MFWALGAVALVLVLLLVPPVPRRAVVVFLVFVRRLFPVLLRKLRLWRRDYTAARAMRLAFEDLGPAYLKFGQMIASSPTAFSQATTEEFARCLDEVRPIPVKQVWTILRAELGGRDPEQVFETIDAAPLASASIAQVHAATLAGDVKVVVKVQRPGIQHRVERDLALMGFIARVAMRCSKELRRANLIGIVHDFRRTIREEMDFRMEADNIEAFSRVMADNHLTSKARAPRVHRELTTARLLTMERFYGVRIDDKPGVDARVDDAMEMLRATSEVFWTCVFLGGFFHGDIHAGNIMVLDDGRLGYIDFGIFGRFSDSDRIALADWVAAMVSDDGEQMARSIKGMGVVKDSVDWPLFVKDVTESFLPLRALTVDKPEMLEEFFPRLRAMAQRHDAHLPGSLVLILKQLTYFGRYVMLHEPSFNENLDPQSQQTFVKIFMKFNAWRAEQGGAAIAIRPSA